MNIALPWLRDFALIKTYSHLPRASRTSSRNEYEHTSPNHAPRMSDGTSLGSTLEGYIMSTSEQRLYLEEPAEISLYGTSARGAMRMPPKIKTNEDGASVWARLARYTSAPALTQFADPLDSAPTPVAVRTQRPRALA